MLRKLLVLFTAFLLATLIPLVSRAANDQTVVVGGGFGGYSFSTTDELRSEVSTPLTNLPALDSAGLGELFVEWYALGQLGFGYRFIIVGDFQGGGFSGERDLTITNHLFTVNWVPLGAESYARLGLVGGLGFSNYDITISNGSVIAGSTTETAALLGAYLDWGGEGFGARAGVHVLSTGQGNVDNLSADASGTGFYLDLRWAF